MKSLTIVGKRWFNRNQGNTYYSATALIDGKSVSHIDYAYGYGNQYETDMMQKLAAEGLLSAPLEKYANGGTEAPWTYCDRNGIAYTALVNDVSRKKDL